MRKFEVGKTYEYGFISDANLKVPVVIERRTDKSVWINGERKKSMLIEVENGYTLEGYFQWLLYYLLKLEGI